MLSFEYQLVLFGKTSARTAERIEKITRTVTAALLCDVHTRVIDNWTTVCLRAFYIAFFFTIQLFGPQWKRIFFKNTGHNFPQFCNV